MILKASLHPNTIESDYWSLFHCFTIDWCSWPNFNSIVLLSIIIIIMG